MHDHATRRHRPGPVPALALCACAALLCAAPVMASGGKGWLLGISYGASEFDLQDLQADRTDDRGSYVKLTGERMLNRHFSVEYGYLDYGSFSAHYVANDEHVSVDGYAMTAAAVASLAILPRVRLRGKVGLDYWSEDVNVDFTFSNRPQHAAGHGSGFSRLFGAGVEYALSREIRLRLEAERYQAIDLDVDLSTNGLEPIDLSGKDVDIIGAAIVYVF